MSTMQPGRVEVPHDDEREFHFQRLFPSDLRREGLIPASLLAYPELAALEAERVRLAGALDAAEAQPTGRIHQEGYIAARTRALRDGTELPPPLPTTAEAQAAADDRNRNMHAAGDALVLWGNTLQRTIAAHPEWRDEAGEKVHAARADAEAALRAAAEAEARATAAEQYTFWLQEAARGNVFYPTFVASGGVPQDEPDLVWAVTDPHILGLMAAARAHQAL